MQEGHGPRGDGAASNLFTRGASRAEAQLFNGEYFQQKTEWRSLRATYPPDDFLSRLFPDSSEGLELAAKEGPVCTEITRRKGAPPPFLP